jgi:hypothetical protein
MSTWSRRFFVTEFRLDKIYRFGPEGIFNIFDFVFLVFILSKLKNTAPGPGIF